MARYDIEWLLKDIRSLLFGSLNGKITSINNEKSDGLLLKLIDANAYFLQELNGKNVNYNPFILYGEEKVEGDSVPGSSIEQVTISIVVVVADQGEDLGDVITKRMLRYRRALKEVIEESFQIIRNANILKVQSLPAVSFKLEEQQNFRAIGINVTSSIG